MFCRTIPAVLTCTAAVLLLFGCRAETTGFTGKRQPKVYANVVSLSPSTSEIVAGYGMSRYLVGRTASCDRPDAVLTAKVVMNDTKPNIEAILDLDPDLIVYDRSLFNDDDVAKIEDIGIETLEYNPTTIDDYVDFCYKLASKLSYETYMSTQIDQIDRAVAAAMALATTNPRTTILLGDGKEDGYLLMGTESFQANILKDCGAAPVGAKGRKFVSANIEGLIDLDPEIIYSDGHAQDVYADPRLQGMTAVKEMRVYDADHRSIVRVGFRLRALVEQFDRDLHELPINVPQAGAR